ncbi:CRISPR-associated exonuclease Cas4 [Scopulibacillus daqui]|uniref:CRISPR-associated exonuclease Cas4 n=1 Tax=Scopulibacillus daqui TaxID=1469162 RepID=A0ABS2PX51_9BACL|nr:CRISPR-associated protein Cas4 [Scopulibacillus daqui]MBM7644543.1 CRISPR-associated exonuclease Cas4 [Scopulibacillus daqui]
MEILATDIKQFVYCPRVIYYTYVEPVPKKVSFKMKYARQQHHILNQKEKRRSLKRYHLIDGERLFGYEIYSDMLNIRGKVDILIDTKRKQGQQYFPVECKDSDSKIHNNVKYQLVAYAMAIEEMTGTRVNKGFIYNINEGKAYPIEITKEQRDFVRKMISMIKKIVYEEYFPEPRSRKRCFDCEFRRYCNDLDIESDNKVRKQNFKKVQELFNLKKPAP